jgi:hypothetical protein
MKIAQLSMGLILCAGSVFAQSFDDDLNRELDQMYEAQRQPVKIQSPSAASQVQVNVQSNPAQVTSQSADVSARVQKQPTTFIEASPLVESRAEKLRKARQDAEVATEQGLVEKLEQTRIEDEKKRADRLFGNKFEQPQEAAVAVQVPAPASPPSAPVVIALPVVKEEPKEEPKKEERIDREALKNDIAEAVATLKPVKESSAKVMYFGAMFGMADYPNAINVRGQYSLGVTVGQNSDSGLAIEGAFIYSNFQVEQREGGIDPITLEYFPRITDMNQYQGSVGAKYRFFDGTLKPSLGGLMAYTYRAFTDSQFALSDETTSSQSIDFGLTAGLDLEVSKNFTIGLDFRYMYNLSSRVNKGFQQSYQRVYLRNDTPIEKINYYNLGLVGKATF